MAYVKDTELFNLMVSFDQKQTTWFNDHFVRKADGMSLISDTTVTAITNHLAEVEGSGGGEGGGETFDIDNALANYFANKTATLSGGGDAA